MMGPDSFASLMTPISNRIRTNARAAFVVSVRLAVWLLLPASASAHSFGALYNLPVPFWLYGFGAAAALVLSFLIVGVFVAAPHSAAPEGSRDIGQLRWVATLRRARF